VTLALLVVAFSPALRRPPRVASLRNIVFAALFGLVVTVVYSAGLLLALSMTTGFYRPVGVSSLQLQTVFTFGAGVWMSLGGYLGALVVNLVVRSP
jgi:hypothetical protein